MSGLAQGFRHAIRQLAKSPVFTAVAILTPSSETTTAYFHLENQPLSTSQTGYGDMSMSMPVVEAMRKRQDVFRDVIGFAALGFDKVAVRVGAEPEEARARVHAGR
ncbi:MAG TPA: hypothetical protein VJN92_20595 [Candidatus Acidoferrum sp.]|nr:hypothetical protein [Candidatus Acidoferrum sp.]